MCVSGVAHLVHALRVYYFSKQHAAELSAAQGEIQSSFQEVREVYFSLIDHDDSAPSEKEAAYDFTHSQLIAELKNKIKLLKEQVCTFDVLTHG